MIVLKALKEIYVKKHINLKLIMVGGKFSAYNEIKNFIQKNNFLRIKYLGKVSFNKLCLLYQNCKFLISPAVYDLAVYQFWKLVKPEDL